MDFKVKSSIAVDVATHIFNFHSPLIPMIPTLLKNQKNQDIVGALGYMLTYHKASEKPLYGLCMG